MNLLNKKSLFFQICCRSLIFCLIYIVVTVSAELNQNETRTGKGIIRCLKSKYWIKNIFQLKCFSTERHFLIVALMLLIFLHLIIQGILYTLFFSYFSAFCFSDCQVRELYKHIIFYFKILRNIVSANISLQISKYRLHRIVQLQWDLLYKVNILIPMSVKQNEYL